MTTITTSTTWTAYADGSISFVLVGGGAGGEYNRGGAGGGGAVRYVSQLAVTQGDTFFSYPGTGGIGGSDGTSASFGQNTQFQNYYGTSGSPGSIVTGRGGDSSLVVDSDTPITYVGGYASDLGGSGGGGGCFGAGGNATDIGLLSVGGNGGGVWDATSFGVTLTCGGGAGCGNSSGVPGTGGGSGCSNVDATSYGGGGGSGDLLTNGGNGGSGVIYVKYLSCSAPTSTTSSSTSSTAPCFRPTATVTLQSGKKKHMKDLKPGDQVLGVNNDGKVVSTPMMVVLHMFLDRRTDFMTLKMQGTSLEVTPDHYIYVKGNSQDFKDKRVISAAEAKPGYEMWTYQDSQLTLQPILDVNRTSLLGYGDVLTGTGNIIADGVVASVYTDLAGSEEAFHRWVAPGRFLYKWAPRLLEYYHRNKQSDFSLDEKLLRWRSPTHKPTRMQKLILKFGDTWRGMLDTHVTHDEL